MRGRTGAGALCAALLLLGACGDGDGAAPARCTRTCTTTDECCSTPPCDKGESATICSGGLCRMVGCTTDADCSGGGGGLKETCKQVSRWGLNWGACGFFCNKDSDCPKLAGYTLKCVTGNPQIPSFTSCGLGCTVDSDCPKISGVTLKCIDSNYCSVDVGAFLCKTDADCGSSKHSRCDVSSGLCTCTSDQACNPSGGSTYKCSKSY